MPHLALLIACAILVAGCSSNPPAPANEFDVLVFSKTAGFRHGSIEAGTEALRTLGSEHNFSVQSTEDASLFTDAGLEPFEVVVFLNTTQDVLDDDQQGAFERFIQAGHGFVGIHAAADTEYDWAWYGGLVGAYFESHPATQEGTVVVTDREHPATAPLPERWTRTDEWYNFREQPAPSVRVLARLDTSSYDGGTMGGRHPIAWAHEYDGGRAFYTGGGHTDESFAEPLFLEHLLGGIRYAAGL